MQPMRPKSTNRDLPPRMVRVRRTLKSGKEWVGFYYNGRSADGQRVKIPLGTDINEARAKWAELEKDQVIDPRTMDGVFDRYAKEILSTKSPRTQKDYLSALDTLRKVFGKLAVGAIRPMHVRQYLDRRSAKVRANREIAVLSTVMTHARGWGYTDAPNPCLGISRNKEQPRAFYASADVWDAVYNAASPELQNAMLLAYLTGQRPADVMKMRWSDVKDGAVRVRQGKTGRALRILLDADGERTQLGMLLDRLKAGGVVGMTLVCLPSGQRFTESSLRSRWDAARLAAAAAHPEIADEIRQFQFRDIRPKAASETDLDHASKLLGHTRQQITQTVYRRVGETVKPTR